MSRETSSSLSSGKTPPSYRLYAFRAATVSSVRAYLLLRLFTFTSSFAFLFLSDYNFLTERSTVSVKALLRDELVISFQISGPHCLPLFCCKPAPIHRYSHDPLCDLLITFPPSNLDRMCIQHSAALVVTLSISWEAFLTSLDSAVCMS